jgi:FixJ family two-component response regulator
VPIFRHLLKCQQMPKRCFPGFVAASARTCPGALVLDVRLPGLSGLDLQKRMTDSDIEMPIIFITGHGDIPMTVQAMKAGAVEFLTKPFRDQDLLDAIQQALDRDRKAREEREEIQNCGVGLPR